MLSADTENFRFDPAVPRRTNNRAGSRATILRRRQTSPATAANGSDSSRIAALLKGGSFWLVVASFFGFGLLLALTPCVFPMIPILSGIIVGQGHHLTKPRAFALSLAYVLGMAITYAAAGVAAGLSGTLLSNALQNRWVLGVFALVFVLLAFSMFGFYELQMPSFIQSRFNDASNKMKGGNAGRRVRHGRAVGGDRRPLRGRAAGRRAALHRPDPRRVAGRLGAVRHGAGHGRAAAGRRPFRRRAAAARRAAGWKRSRAFFGVLLLGVAIWLISPVIPAVAHMLLWAALLIVSAIYLHALDPLPHPASGWSQVLERRRRGRADRGRRPAGRRTFRRARHSAAAVRPARRRYGSASGRKRRTCSSSESTARPNWNSVCSTATENS